MLGMCLEWRENFCACLSCEILASRNLQCSTTEIGNCVQMVWETCLICCELVCILLLMSSAKVYVGLNWCSPSYVYSNRIVWMLTITSFIQFLWTVLLVRFVWEVGQTRRKEEWKSVLTGSGAQSVTHPGTTVKLRWHAGNLDSLQMVSFFASIMHGFKMRILLQLHDHLQMLTLDVALVPYFLTDLAALAMSRLCSTAHIAE